MKSKKFIETKLNELYSKFNEIQIKYEYRANTLSHLIEVIPFSLFDGNEVYMNLEATIEDEFEILFPNENIVFISEGSLSEIKSADFELGYDAIKFDHEVFNIEFDVAGFNDCLDSYSSNNYALAA